MTAENSHIHDHDSRPIAKPLTATAPTSRLCALAPRLQEGTRPLARADILLIGLLGRGGRINTRCPFLSKLCHVPRPVNSNRTSLRQTYPPASAPALVVVGAGSLSRVVACHPCGLGQSEARLRFLR